MRKSFQYGNLFKRPSDHLFNVSWAISSANINTSFFPLSNFASSVSTIAGCSGLSSSSEIQLGPLNQSCVSLSGTAPHVPRSLGFSLVGTYFQDEYVSSSIFLTRFRTKVDHSLRFASQYSTVMLSTQLW